jgi:hypothetical protein
VTPDPLDVADRTIRNQRYHGWPAWAWILGWFAAWLPAAWLLESLTPRDWEKPALAAVGVPILATFIFLVRHLDRRPAERIRLGDELRAYPSGQFQPADLVCIQFSPDDDEDYAEDKLPVPWCQVAVRGRRGRTIRLVASHGDAVRLREWAERNGVAVIDPDGLATRGVRTGPS